MRGDLKKIRGSLVDELIKGLLVAVAVGHLSVFLEVLDFLGHLSLGSPLDSLLSEPTSIDEVLLLLGDLVAAHVDSLRGAVSSILGVDVELEGFLLGLTSELDALSPEEVGLLGFLSVATTLSPYLAIQPAVARVVTGEVADGTAQAPDGVKDFIDDFDVGILLFVIAGEERFGLLGLLLLTFDDLVYRKDSRQFVFCLLAELPEVFFVALLFPHVLIHTFAGADYVEEDAEVERVDWVGGVHGVRIGGVRFVESGLI